MHHISPSYAFNLLFQAHNVMDDACDSSSPTKNFFRGPDGSTSTFIVIDSECQTYFTEVDLKNSHAAGENNA